jgi:hypothetical protein
MESLKNKKGITLIALVITIIVLLVLAGITISLTIGQGGIITTATGAGNNYVQAYNNEQTQIDDLYRETGEILKGTDDEDDATGTESEGSGTEATGSEITNPEDNGADGEVTGGSEGENT